MKRHFPTSPLASWAPKAASYALAMALAIPAASATPPPADAIVPPDMALETDGPELSAAKAAITSIRTGASVDQIVAACRPMPPEVVKRALLDQAASADERVREAAVRVSARLPKPSRSIALAALSDAAPSVVIAGYETLASLGKPPRSAPATEGETAVLGAIEAGLVHRSVAVRCAAIDAATRLLPKKQLVASLGRRSDASVPRELSCLTRATVSLGQTTFLDRAIAALDDLDTHSVLAPAIGQSGKLLGPALTRGLPTSPDARVSGALAALAGHPDRIAIAGKLLVSLQGSPRDLVLSWLVAHAADKGAPALLSSALEKGAPETRAAVLSALAKSDARAVAPVARRFLADPSVKVRAAAAQVFAKAPDRRETTLLVEAYQRERANASDENLPVRTALLTALGGTGASDLAPLFVDAITQPGEANAAVEALVALGPGAASTLALVIKMSDAVRTPYVLDALSRIGSGVGETAEPLFAHPRETVRKIGRDLMAASQDPSAVTALIRLLGSDRVDDPVPLIQAIATFSSDDAVAALVTATDSPSPAVRAAASEGLADTQTRDPAAFDAIVRLAETDTDVNVRVAAVTALYRLGYDGLVKLLGRLVAYDVPEVRIVAWDILGWTRDPAAAIAIAQKLGDAEGREKDVIQAAIVRVTGRTDLSSSRALREWAAATTEGGALDPAKLGGVKSTVKLGSVSATIHAFGAGFPAVVLAGGHSGRAYGPSLAAAGGARWVTWEARGRGATPYGGREITLEQEIADLEALRVGLAAEKLRLVAHGAAAYVAIAYAKAHPTRVTGLLLESAPPVGGRSDIDSAAARRLEGRLAYDLATLDARFAWYAPASYLRYRFAMLASGLVTSERDAARLRADAPAPAAAQAVSHAAGKRSLVKELSGVACPVMLVYGDKSPFGAKALAPIESLSAAGKITLQRIEGAAHYPHLEQPNAFAGALRTFASLR
ncbi:MAG: HEAT repeat domain-containing protein [Myxococcales bacterium]|nr:HEAT repeat domain-containing protein [Myxococcales bacterium]